MFGVDDYARTSIPVALDPRPSESPEAYLLRAGLPDRLSLEVLPARRSPVLTLASEFDPHARACELAVGG